MRLAPKIHGGLMATRSHEISDLWAATNSHAAFSASVFEAWYIVFGSVEPSVFTALTAASFQLVSLKMRGNEISSKTATTEEVRTTRFTLLPCFKAEFRIDVVPRTAGMMRSAYVLLDHRRGLK